MRKGIGETRGDRIEIEVKCRRKLKKVGIVHWYLLGLQNHTVKTRSFLFLLLHSYLLLTPPSCPTIWVLGTSVHD